MEFCCTKSVLEKNETPKKFWRTAFGENKAAKEFFLSPLRFCVSRSNGFQGLKTVISPVFAYSKFNTPKMFPLLNKFLSQISSMSAPVPLNE